MRTKKRVIVIVNKYWECDPVCWVLTNEYIMDQCGINLNIAHSFKNNNFPSYGPVKPPHAKNTVPRMYFETSSRIVEIWCISDLLSNSPAKLQSSSEEKMKLLPIIFDFHHNGKMLDIELVIAVGTASSGPNITKNPILNNENINGSVLIGSNVFLHNGWDKDSVSHFVCDCWGKLLQSKSNDLIHELQKVDFKPYEQLLLTPPTNPSPIKQHFYVSENFVALGDINVSDYTKYTVKDQETGDEFGKNYPDNLNGVSVETTHGLIYLAAKECIGNPPFMFISGVTDRFTMFSTDVNPKVYAQNVSCAHNAGVAVAYIISQLIK